MIELLIYSSAVAAVLYAVYILLSHLFGKRKGCKECGKCK